MVEIRLNQTQETIGAADSLVAGLEVEFRRWNNEVEVMGRDLKVVSNIFLDIYILYMSFPKGRMISFQMVPNDSLLASAFIVYLSSAPEDLRRHLMEKWQILLDDGGGGGSGRKFDLKRFLSSERQMLRWRTEGLPSDQLSVENAMCILNSQQSVFIVDPSNR